jgi:hypothetical protein
MDSNTLKEFVRHVVSEARALKDRHTSEPEAPVNYACIFAQSEAEYKELLKAAESLGKVVKEMSSGLLYHIENLETSAGVLRILKIRIPDPTRPELGDADFTVSDYPSFKKKYLSHPGFKLITRPEMEMIELMELNCPVRAYFSHPPVDQQILGSIEK